MSAHTPGLTLIERFDAQSFAAGYEEARNCAADTEINRDVFEADMARGDDEVQVDAFVRGWNQYVNRGSKQ